MAESAGRLTRLVQQSVFFKLFLIYVTTTLVLILTVWGLSRLVLHEPMAKQVRGRMMARQLGHIIEEIGSPPSFEQAMQLSKELGIQIRVEGAGPAWATDPSLPESAALTVGHTHTNPDRKVGWYRGRLFVIMVRGTTRYVFFFPESPGLATKHVVLIVAMIALILAGSYAIVRWLFRPLDWLAQGVAEIASGNLGHKVSIRSHDELGQLTSALNDMASRIRDMFRARDRLLLDVSHELRSPLTRMKVALEFVHEESVRDKLQQEIRELETMVTELLESERLNSDHGGLVMSKIDLVALVRELVESYDGQGSSVKVIEAPPALPVSVDRDRLRMAVRNVLENAVKHSLPKRGPVLVRVATVDGKTVEISIQDHGPGIPAEEHQRIFEPFYRVDTSRARATGGYGLGLSLTKKIMTAHGGDIFLVSEPGKGSTFTLTLPLGIAGCP